MSNRSLWWRRAAPVAPRPPLVGSADADVAIVGGGFTGLWTAFYLKALAPDLVVRVLEAGQVGFGASGRNGGWCSALFPASATTIAEQYGSAAAIAMQRAMFATIDEVEGIIGEHGIDCGWARGGTVSLARSAVHLTRATEQVADMRTFGFGADDYALLDAEAARVRLAATDVLGAVYTPHCAALDPLALVRGLAAAVEAAGVVIHERSEVTQLAPGRVTTRHGEVRAGAVIRATEAYTARFSGAQRDLVPVYSLVIATEPLPESLWRDIGLARRETFTDLRHLIIYGQRSDDDRLVFGGRGAPYHFGSAIRNSYDLNPRVHRMLAETLVELLPQVRGIPITDAWGGPLGIARDWWARVCFDDSTRFGWAGGYVGDGVGTSNLAGRTLAHLVTGTESPLLDLPWVNRTLPRWEPEPLRWLGANAALAAVRSADALESRTGRPSRLAAGVERLLGS